MNQASSLKLTPYQNLQEILKVIVEATRKILRCDRVFTYSAANLPQAEVIAESVEGKYVSILGQSIKDPFLEGDRLEMYCYGISLTIDDIYAANVNQEKLKDLETLDVKSVAIAPISIENQLLAFLVAHRCSQLQPWDLEVASILAEQAHNAEIAIVENITAKKSPNYYLARQIAEITKNQVCPVVTTERLTEKNQDGSDLLVTETSIAESLEQPILEIEEIDRPESKKAIDTVYTEIQSNNSRLHTDVSTEILVTKDIDRASEINREQKLENILTAAVTETIELLKCDRAIVCSVNKAGNVVVIAESSVNGYAPALGKNIDSVGFTAEHRTEYSQGGILVWRNPNDSQDKDTYLYYLEQLKILDVRAGVVAPITKDNRLFGLLIAHQCSNSRNWQKTEINSINQIAINLTTMFEYINLSNDRKYEEQLTEVQKQLEKEKSWTEHLADLIRKIRASIEVESILENGVGEVHRILECDRVIVYALNRDSYGEIVAESVSNGWTRGKGKVIKDPCFEARYLEKYRDGRFRAWNNIYSSGMSECYIEQLEKLEVKANIVVPLVKEDKLFGLLVVHQCDGTRQWQQSEILWLTQVATQMGFALDNAQLIADARKLRQQVEEERLWTQHFSEAVQQIRQSLKTKDVCRASVREARRVLNCDRVVVYALNKDSYGEIIAESVGHGWTRSQGRVIKDPCFEARYLDSYRDGRVRAWSNIYEAGMSRCYIEQLEKLEVKANIVTPIISKGKLFGLLVAHQCDGTRQWQQQEINWLTQIASQVGFAIENAQMLEQIEQNTKDARDILTRTLESSSQIQNAVQNVTTGLVNLNNSCQKFAEAIQKIKDLSKQLAQQSMNMTRTLNLSQSSANDPNEIAKQSDEVFTLMQKLFEATGMIEPLFDNIKTEITAKTALLESENHSLVKEVNEFETANQKLDCIVVLNHQMSNLIEDVSSSLEDQIQNTHFTQDSIQELESMTKRISQQSVTVIDSFNQLALLYM